MASRTPNSVIRPVVVCCTTSVMRSPALPWSSAGKQLRRRRAQARTSPARPCVRAVLLPACAWSGEVGARAASLSRGRVGVGRWVADTGASAWLAWLDGVARAKPRPETWSEHADRPDPASRPRRPGSRWLRAATSGGFPVAFDARSSQRTNETRGSGAGRPNRRGTC